MSRDGSGGIGSSDPGGSLTFCHHGGCICLLFFVQYLGVFPVHWLYPLKLQCLPHLYKVVIFIGG
ncbi:hypothetical protein BaRGS_00019578, partial [Batillaria attramentaria]